MDTCVRVNEDADILLVDLAASEVTMGVIEDLAHRQIMRPVYSRLLTNAPSLRSEEVRVIVQGEYRSDRF